jgi:hypothetical protein
MSASRCSSIIRWRSGASPSRRATSRSRSWASSAASMTEAGALTATPVQDGGRQADGLHESPVEAALAHLALLTLGVADSQQPSGRGTASSVTACAPLWTSASQPGTVGWSFHGESRMSGGPPRDDRPV